MNRAAAALLALACALFVGSADAFCGFYVAGADAKLFNSATVVAVAGSSPCPRRYAAPGTARKLSLGFEPRTSSLPRRCSTTEL